MRTDLPTGTVTFLFTDVEGSTRLLDELGTHDYADALAEHRRILREATDAYGGVEVDTQGDAFFIAFPFAPGATAAAAAVRDSLAAGPIRVRMGIHTGTPHLTEEGYIGADVHLAARIASAGHGGQILMSAATVAIVGPDGLRDLGEHRFKDFDEPISVYQLGDERFPPLRTISNTNLPRPASSFVGRETEVTEIASLLQDGARLLTLTGPGGTGKTRVAIEAAATLVSEFKAGVFWIGLAPLRDPALVSETIAQTLGAKGGVAEHIGEREMLLLLDNLEQVIEAAPDLATLVETCSNLRLLVTSRERLRVRGEVEYPVQPLAEREAVDLFSARSGLDPDPTIAELCRRLDNLPLAVELAAARTAVLTPTEILERISQRLDLLKGGRDADARQQTLRSTIEWSYELLNGDEQRLFARLAVFAGGCTVDAAERVIDADLNVLQSLIDKSLVRHTDGRFWMLETIREFAGERLEESGDANEIHQRHADYFLTLAEVAEPHLRGPNPAEWPDRLDAEHDNLRGALDWFGNSAALDERIRLAGALDEFWCKKNHWSEGRRHLEAAVAGDQRPTPARAKALVGAAHLARDMGDATAAKRRATEGLAIYAMVGERPATAMGLFWLGASEADLGDFRASREHFEASAQVSEEFGDEYSALFANRMLTWAYYELGDKGRATALHEDQLRRARGLGVRDLEASILGALASYAVEDGRLGDAASMAAESIRIEIELEQPQGIATEVCRGAAALAPVGEAETATQLLASATAFHEDAGLGMLPYLARENEQTLTKIHAQLSASAFDEAWQRGWKLTLEDAAALALSALGGIAAGTRPSSRPPGRTEGAKSGQDA